MEKELASPKKVLIRIAVVGPESTGKSTISKQLALHYKTIFVPEMAREYLGRLTGKYTLRDIEEISKIQIQHETQCENMAKKILFCDTNLVVTKIWAEFVFGTCTNWIEENLLKKTYDLHLLMFPDTIWEPDKLREHPRHRMELFSMYKNLLTKMNVRFEVITGKGEERLLNAISVVEKIISTP